MNNNSKALFVDHPQMADPELKGFETTKYTGTFKAKIDAAVGNRAGLTAIAKELSTDKVSTEESQKALMYICSLLHSQKAGGPKITGQECISLCEDVTGFITLEKREAFFKTPSANSNAAFKRQAAYCYAKDGNYQQASALMNKIPLGNEP